MKDFMEIMNFCGYDLERADRMAKDYRAAIEEEMTRVGLETLESEPMWKECRGLYSPGCKCSAGGQLV